MSIPSSPELERFVVEAFIVTPWTEQALTKAVTGIRELQHVASTQPLLAEIERLKGEKDTVFGWLEYEKQKAAAAEAEAQKLREKSVQDDAWFEHSCVQRIELAEANAGLKTRVTTLEVALKELLEAASNVIHPSVENNTWLRNKLASARKALGGSK